MLYQAVSQNNVNSPHKMKKLLSVAVIALFVQGNAPAHSLRGFWGGVPDAYSGTVEQAEGAGNAQRWLLCLMLTDGLIDSKKADKAVSLISEFNDKVFNKYTEEYGKLNDVRTRRTSASCTRQIRRLAWWNAGAQFVPTSPRL